MICVIVVGVLILVAGGGVVFLVGTGGDAHFAQVDVFAAAELIAVGAHEPHAVKVEGLAFAAVFAGTHSFGVVAVVYGAPGAVDGGLQAVLLVPEVAAGVDLLFFGFVAGQAYAAVKQGGGPFMGDAPRAAYGLFAVSAFSLFYHIAVPVVEVPELSDPFGYSVRRARIRELLKLRIAG